MASSPPLTQLEELDHEVKRIIKAILHLHPSTTDGILYTPKKHGELGVQKMSDIIRIAKLRSGLNMLRDADPAVREAAERQENVLSRYARTVGLQWPTTAEEIEEARVNLKQKHIHRWEQLASQGQGVHEFKNDKIGNAWLQRPALLKPSRYLDALKLRSNTFGTRVVLRRQNKEIDPMCRRCKMQLETLGHVIGNFLFTKNKRIHRHNEVVKIIEEKASQRSAVFLEPSINVLGELKKPDLVIKDQERLLVVDITIRYEDRDNLKQAMKEKVEKYRDTAELLRLKLNCLTTEVLPVVTGSRGAIPLGTKRVLKDLGLSDGDILTVSLIALRSSIELCNAFPDYDHIM